MTGEKGVSWRILNFITPEINSSRKNHDFITPKTFHDGKKVHFCDANIFLFCTSTPTHKTNSEYTQRRTPGGCTTTRPALLLQVLIFHLNKETSISLGETGAVSPPQSPLSDHTSLGFPTSRHAHPSPPFYVMFCFMLTYRVSPYLERSLLCLLDLSSIVKADLQGYATTVGTSISGVGKVPVSLEVLLLCCMRLCVSV